MSIKVQPQQATATTTSMPSPSPALLDWHTWVAVLTNVAMVLTVVFHQDFSAYIPLVSIAAATLYNIFFLIVKHKYASALVAAGRGLTQTSAVAPSNIASELHKAASVIQAVNDIQGTLKAAEATTTATPVASVLATSTAQA